MDNRYNMLLCSLLGDSFALGLHWVYNTDSIRESFGRVEQLMAPAESKYHPRRSKGENTHYGDQTLLLAAHIVKHRGFDEGAFRGEWADFMRDYDGYVDGASQDALTDLEKGSGSDDLGGPARLAPVAYWYEDDWESLRDAAVAQTRVTHNNPASLQTARALALILYDVLNGSDPETAIRDARRELEDSPEIAALLDLGLESRNRDSITTIKELGQNCHLTAALPSAIHLIVKYRRDHREAHIQNVLAGGDSAARGLVIGAVLGAAGEQLPASWVEAYRNGAALRQLAGSGSDRSGG